MVLDSEEQRTFLLAALDRVDVRGVATAATLVSVASAIRDASIANAPSAENLRVGGSA